MRLLNKKYIEIRTAGLDDLSTTHVLAPETAVHGRIRFATVVQALPGTAVHGVTPLERLDPVVLNTSWTGETIVPADDVLGFWHVNGGAVRIVPVGERVVVESGYLHAGEDNYGCYHSDLERGCGLVREIKLGEHATLRSVSLGSKRYDEILPGVNRRCWIEHINSHGDITVAMFGSRALLFVPVAKLQAIVVAADGVDERSFRVEDGLRIE